MARQCTIWAISSMRVASVCGEDLLSSAGKSLSIVNEGCTCMQQEQAQMGSQRLQIFKDKVSNDTHLLEEVVPVCTVPAVKHEQLLLHGLPQMAVYQGHQ